MRAPTSIGLGVEAFDGCPLRTAVLGMAAGVPTATTARALHVTLHVHGDEDWNEIPTPELPPWVSVRVLGDPDPCWKGWQLEGIRVVTRLIAAKRIAAAVLSRVYAPGRCLSVIWVSSSKRPLEEPSGPSSRDKGLVPWP